MSELKLAYPDLESIYVIMYKIINSEPPKINNNGILQEILEK